MVGAFAGGFTGGAGVSIVITAVDRFSKELNKAQGGFGKLGALAKGAFRTGILAGGTALAALGAIGVKTGNQLQQARVAFDTMLGSAEKAKKLLTEITNFAKKTPFELPGVISASKQLLAMGAATERDMIPVLRALGDVAAGTGADMTRIALNFGQVATQGKLTGRELRDFAVQGIPIISALADQFGVTKKEIQDMTSAGKIGFGDVREAFMSMSGEGGQFFDLMTKQSDTLGGRFSNLKDSISLLGAELLGISSTGELKKGGLFDRLSNTIKSIVDFFEQNKDKIKAFFAALKPVFNSIADVVKSSLDTLREMARTIKDKIGGDGKKRMQKMVNLFQTVLGVIKGINLGIKAFFRGLDKLGVLDQLVFAFKVIGFVLNLIIEGVKALVLWVAIAAEKLRLISEEELLSLDATLNKNLALEMEQDYLDSIAEKTEEISDTSEDTTEEYKEQNAVLNEQVSLWDKIVAGVRAGGANARYLDSLSAAGRTQLRGSSRGTTGGITLNGSRKNDFLMRPGMPAVNFSPEDTIIGLKNPSKLGGKGMNIFIDTIQGLDPDAVSRSLQDKLSQVINV